MLIIETPRILMREFELDIDIPELYQLNSDPAVVRYTGDKPFESVDHARAYFEPYARNNYEAHGTGRWACIRKEDGAWLGWCGIKYAPQLDEYDLGYRFHQRYWGQGYATETALAAVDYAFNVLKVNELVGRAATDNIASVAVLKRVGMQFDRLETCGCDPGEVYKMTSTEFK
jgi:[ribosomal protein S5]-alanine N-acetyltransferase